MPKEKRGGSPGSASVGVGACLIALGVVVAALTYCGVLPAHQWTLWVLPTVTNYDAACVAVLVGALMLGYGLRLRAMSAEAEAQARRTALALKRARGKLQKVKEKARKDRKTVLRKLAEAAKRRRK